MSAAVVLCGSQAPPVEGRAGATAVVPDLCAYPAQLAGAVRGADRLVLGVCPGELSLSRVQTEARRLGLDPLGIELVDLSEAEGDGARLALLVAAAAARAEAFAGSEPHHAKLSFPREVSRRDVLRALSPEYRAAPGIFRNRCAADLGCRACVDACPRRAYRWVDGRIEYDRAACEPCGVCVTTCPAGAIVNPAITPAQLEAQLGALLDVARGPSGPRAIAFACSRGDVSVAAPHWYAVRVPCTAMVTATWLLAPLLLGAGAVALLPCSESGCPLGLDRPARATVDFAAALLAGLDATDRLQPVGGAVPPAWAPAPLDDPFGPLGGAGVLAGLAAATGTDLPDLPHSRSPLGVVAIDPQACTLCGMCAATCPTGSLAYRAGARDAELSFDPAWCTGCGQCVPRCPELRAGAIALERRVDPGALAAGRATAAHSPAARCETCGGPVAAAPLLRQLRDRLGPEHEATYRAIASRCPACRRLPTRPGPANR